VAGKLEGCIAKFGLSWKRVGKEEIRAAKFSGIHRKKRE
jgi:hypothetical protein